jgi:hypothetical protein
VLASLASAIDLRWRRFTHGWHRTNCLFFALALYARRHARIQRAEPGDKLYGRRHYRLRRRSDSGWFPHFLYAEDMPHSGLRLISYKPPNPIDRKCPPVLFSGAVRWGDAVPNSDSLKG